MNDQSKKKRVALAVAIAVKLATANSGYDTEEEEEIEELCLFAVRNELEGCKGNPIPRIEGYVERIIPQFSALEFKEHFRMFPDTFEFVLHEVHDFLTRKHDGNPTIPPRKRLMIAIWRLATPDSYRSVIQRFGVGKATAIRAVRRVTRALTRIAPPKFIKWPEGDSIQVIINGFEENKRFPGVIGAVDGTHIYIRAPEVHPEEYVNRKKRHSIQLQAVCDHRSIFTHCYTGQVGSVHDARVFSLSPLQQYIGDETKFPRDAHILGDAAYKLYPQVMTPYIDNGHLTERQRNYNERHSSTRMAIERAFGLLKGRWRSLLDVLAMDRTDLIPYHIMACCVQHNICLLRHDELRALALGDRDVNQPVAHNHEPERMIAVAKRDRICAELP